MAESSSGRISKEQLIPRIGTPTHLFSKVFPFYLAFNPKHQVVHIGNALETLGLISPNQDTINQQLRIISPSNLRIDFELLRRHENIWLDLEFTQRSLKGWGFAQYLSEEDLLLLVICPRLPDLKSLVDLAAELSDYSLQDSISDLLFLLKARLTTLADTKKLAEQLTAQRMELHRALNQAELAITILEQAADSIEITDASLKILYVNTAFEQMTGFSRHEVMGKTSMSLFRSLPHENAIAQEIQAAIATGNVWHGTCIGQRKNESFYHQEATIFPVHNRAGSVTNFVAIRRDISNHKRDQTRLEHSLSLLKATFEATADGILVIDIRGKILHFNQKFVDLWNIPLELLANRDHRYVTQFIAQNIKNPKAFSSKSLLELYVRPHVANFDVLELKDDRVFERYACPQRIDDVVIGWVWSFRDITERQRSEAKMRHQALHDALTGLPNRLLFNDRLALALSQVERKKTKLAVFFLDLDRFKLINDTLGHAVGDRLLQEFAQRMTGCLRAGDTVARWAGDEFTLLLPDIHSEDEVTAIAQRILDALKPDVVLDGHSLRMSTSIGIAIYPTDGEDAETLIKNADAALYRAKEAGRNAYQIYTAALSSDASELLKMENHLHRALDRQEFCLYYQPQVNIQTGEIIQVEALIRWHHPELGVVPPSKFIPLAEETGLIVAIGEWVLRTACAQNRLWHEAGFSHLGVAVNLSARQFQYRYLVEQVTQILQASQLAPHSLELEITESIAMQNVSHTRVILDHLHQMGVLLSLDDFGTGYSSLSYLKNFPLHTIKIDRSFVRELVTDDKDAAIITSMIALGKGLNLRVVAEGVETLAQRDLLKHFSCEIMQGYLFSPPVPASEVTALLEQSYIQSASLKNRGDRLLPFPYPTSPQAVNHRMPS